MAITFTATRSIPKSTKVRVRIVTTDAVEAGVAGISDGQLSSAGFSGKPGDTHVVPDGKRTEALIGIGDAADVDTDAVRRSAAAVGRFGRYGKLGVELPETELDGAAVRQALVEGIALDLHVHHLQVRAKPSKLRPSRSPVALVRRTRRRSTGCCNRPGPNARPGLRERTRRRAHAGRVRPSCSGGGQRARSRRQGVGRGSDQEGQARWPPA